MSGKFDVFGFGDDKAGKVGEILSNKTARKILEYLKENQASETEIAKELGLAGSTVNYNIKKLLGNGLIEVKKSHWSAKGNKVNVYKATEKMLVFVNRKPRNVGNKLKYIIPSIIVIGAILFLGYLMFLYPDFGAVGTPASIRIGETVNISVETEHPYPNSEQGRKVVWTYTLKHEGTPGMKVHFKNFNLSYGEINVPEELIERDYGECSLDAPPGYIREMIDENTIKEYSIPDPDKEGDGVGSARIIKCGIIYEKEEFSFEEIIENDWITGDFLVIKDGNGKILDIIQRSALFMNDEYDFWSTGYPSDTLVLELYADEENNNYGFEIDQYSWLYTEEQMDENRRQRYLESCEEGGIPEDKCIIPK